MTSYRFFLIGANEHYKNVHVFDCRDDREAIARGRQFVNGVDVEVWQRMRFVARLSYRSAA